MVGRLRHITRWHPNRFYIFGMVDIWVPVSLDFIDRVVPGNLLGRYRILLVPGDQQVQIPGLKRRVRGPVEHGIGVRIIGIPGGDDIFVPGGHVEIGSGKISFVRIDRFEHNTRIPQGGATPFFAPVGGGGRGGAHHCKGIIAVHVVHILIGRKDMMQIGVHRRVVVEPAFGKRVLPAVAIPLRPASARTALIRTESEFIHRGAARNVGVHVPYLAVGLLIGRIESVPDTRRITDYRMTLDDVVEGDLQGFSGLPGGTVVIARGDGAPRNKGKKQEGRQQQGFCTARECMIGRRGQASHGRFSAIHLQR